MGSQDLAGKKAIKAQLWEKVATMVVLLPDCCCLRNLKQGPLFFRQTTNRLKKQSASFSFFSVPADSLSSGEEEEEEVISVSGLNSSALFDDHHRFCRRVFTLALKEKERAGRSFAKKAIFDSLQSNGEKSETGAPPMSPK